MSSLKTEALEIAAALCRHFEGFYPNPHLCPRGVPTIGFGATFYADGTRVTLQDRWISRAQAEKMLIWDLMEIRFPTVLRLCPTLDTPERLGAILSWTFNLGGGNLQGSTLRKRILARDFDAVPMQIRRWVFAGKDALPGLRRRRNAEALVFMDYPRAQRVLEYLPQPRLLVA